MPEKDFIGGTFTDHFMDFVGETVTIFTTSGGASGCGFTGVILKVNPCFVRLICSIGPAPGCALGNACSGLRRDRDFDDFRCRRGLGSVVDIPIDRIAAFVHNAV